MPSGDITALPKRLDGMLIVVRAHERHGGGGRHPIKDGQAGQGGAGAPAAASTGDFNPVAGGALPGFGQDRQHLGPVGGQAEVGPSEPSRFPRDGGRRLAEQIDREGRAGSGWERAREAAASNQPTRGELYDAWRRGVPPFAHNRIVRAAPAWLLNRGREPVRGLEALWPHLNWRSLRPEAVLRAGHQRRNIRILRQTVRSTDPPGPRAIGGQGD